MTTTGTTAGKAYEFLQLDGSTMRPGTSSMPTSLQAAEGYIITREGPMYFVEHDDFADVTWEIPMSNVRGAWKSKGKK